MELKKILCAVDLKDSVNPAVEYAKMLSELSGASISAIYVVSSRSAYENLQVPVEDIAKGMRSIWSRARGDMDAFVEKQFPGMDVNGSSMKAPRREDCGDRQGTRRRHDRHRNPRREVGSAVLRLRGQ